jgi:hypothetical protein
MLRIGLRVASAGVVALLLASASCKEREASGRHRFPIFVRVEGDPGQKVAGAQVLHDESVIGITGVDGRTMLTLEGIEGQAMDVTVRCPNDFTTPARPTTIRLVRFADKTKIPEYAVACRPALRHVVIAVQADNGPNLPVLYQNRIITRTDASGAAHFALEVAPGALFQVALDTSENTRLRPANPARSFTAPQDDAILVFEQRFDVDRPHGGLK